MQASSSVGLTNSACGWRNKSLIISCLSSKKSPCVFQSVVLKLKKSHSLWQKGKKDIYVAILSFKGTGCRWFSYLVNGHFLSIDVAGGKLRAEDRHDSHFIGRLAKDSLIFMTQSLHAFLFRDRNPRHTVHSVSGFVSLRWLCARQGRGFYSCVWS